MGTVLVSSMEQAARRAQGQPYSLSVATTFTQQCFLHLVENSKELTSHSWRRVGPTAGQFLGFDTMQLNSLGDWQDKSSIPREASMPLHYSAARYDLSLRTKHMLHIALGTLTASKSWEVMLGREWMLSWSRRSALLGPSQPIAKNSRQGFSSQRFWRSRHLSDGKLVARLQSYPRSLVRSMGKCYPNTWRTVQPYVATSRTMHAGSNVMNAQDCIFVQYFEPQVVYVVEAMQQWIAARRSGCDPPIWRRLQQPLLHQLAPLARHECRASQKYLGTSGPPRRWGPAHLHSRPQRSSVLLNERKARNLQLL